MSAENKPDVLTVAQLAARLNVSTAAVYDAIARGEIPTVPIGKSKRIPVRWLERVLSAGDTDTP